MTQLILLVGGNAKNSEEEKIFNKYQKRILWPLKVIEVKNTKELKDLFIKKKKDIDCWILLDEKGQDLSSKDFAFFLQKKIELHQQIGFIIGVDTGVVGEIKEQVHEKISFGKKTWPHLLVRVLLIEQIYRAQQILNHHPYHKE